MSLATIYSGPGPDDRRYVLEVWTQPWIPWLVAQAYHWYDMRIYKVPGFKRLEQLLRSRHQGNDWYIPLSAQQDIRCYHLKKRRREIAAVVQLSEEQYCNIRKVL